MMVLYFPTEPQHSSSQGAGAGPTEREDHGIVRLRSAGLRLHRVQQGGDVGGRHAEQRGLATGAPRPDLPRIPERPHRVPAHLLAVHLYPAGEQRPLLVGNHAVRTEEEDAGEDQEKEE